MEEREAVRLSTAKLLSTNVTRATRSANKQGKDNQTSSHILVNVSMNFVHILLRSSIDLYFESCDTLLYAIIHFFNRFILYNVLLLIFSYELHIHYTTTYYYIVVNTKI
ncbi:uncharacterized protein LOC116414459 [Apis florea]|uniref:uncharacterized protein LOC116414459 n=1 Tax=Apis florea TaxID=7463 RepID=UPI0012FF0F70|nr:uncharacterized protein LOC116414459 [Apis florea]